VLATGDRELFVAADDPTSDSYPAFTSPCFAGSDIAPGMPLLAYPIFGKLKIVFALLSFICRKC
jgi:hypothetical protein